MKFDNLLLNTDVYKLSHMRMYAPGTTKVYSYLCARAGKRVDNRVSATLKQLMEIGAIKEVDREAIEAKMAENHSQGADEVVFFGLQYLLEEYFSKPITLEHAEEFFQTHQSICGEVPEDVRTKILALVELGYLPLEIKAIPEGTKVPVKNALLTITNTNLDFPWVVGYVESLLLKLWNSITVATVSNEYRTLVDDAFNQSVDEDVFFLRDFSVHDFGYRGSGSEESAAVEGMAHLLSFTGSDDVIAHQIATKTYGAVVGNELIMASVPASEHSVMCSYGEENEFDAFKNILDLYPTGIVSIVSDTYNIWNVITDFLPRLKSQIMARDGKTVLRPDSGNPEYIICGDPNAEPGTPAAKGCLVLLDELFGHTINSKGYKVLDSHVGLIYGDGMYLARYKRTLDRMEAMGYAANNLVIGVGGILRNNTRDTLGFAIKATYVEVDGVARNISKNPITDTGKKSHKGLMALLKDADGKFYTKDCCTPEEEKTGFLKTAFLDGKVVNKTTLAEMRNRLNG